jgi:hypothetical protein
LDYLCSGILFPSTDADSVRQGAVKIIAGLESEFKESFLEVAKAKGYSTSQAGVSFPLLRTLRSGGSTAQVVGIWIAICNV